MKTVTKTKRPKITDITPECRELIIGMHLKGETNQLISDTVKLYTHSTIGKFIRPLKLELSEDAIKYKKANHAAAKLASTKTFKPCIVMTDDVVVDILNRYDAGETVDSIDKTVHGNVRKVLTDNGRSTASKTSIRAITPENLNLITQMYLSGSTQQDIADATGIYTKRQIHLLLKKHNITLSDEVIKQKGKDVFIKASATVLNRYGVDCAAQLPQTIEKSHTQDVIEKQKAQRDKSNMEKYGVKNVYETEHVKEQIKETMLDTYGYEHITKAPDYADTVTGNNQHTLPIATREFLYNKEKMEDMYDDYNFNHYKMAGALDISVSCMWNYLKRHDIPNIKISAPELAIHKMLDGMGITNYVIGDRTIIKPLELDVYLPDYNIAIEVNGMYWHSDKFKPRNYHLDKTEKCDAMGVQVLHFWDLEIMNTPHLVESLIRDVLDRNTTDLWASDCSLVECSEQRAKDFLIANNIQQYAIAQLNYALEYNGDIVSIMTFAKSRFNINYEWEMVRLCNKLNTSIIGAKPRLMAQFRQEHKGSLITYTHRGYSSGAIYKKLGFTLDGTTNPSVVYAYGGEIYRRGSPKANLENTITCYNSGNFRYIMD